MAKSLNHFVALWFLVALAGCADGPCRQLRHPELAGAPAGTPAAPQTPAQVKPAGPESKNVGAPENASTVLVYKADGSLQCKAAKGLSVEEMEKQLTGIKVFSRDKRDDGLMHIQVCGSPTGQINVYEIPASSLKESEAKGFKKLDHR